MVGRLAEGERIGGSLNHQAKKVIADIDFDVDWKIAFNLPLIDLEKEYQEQLGNDLVEANTQGQVDKKSCVIKADQSEVIGVDSVALFYPEEGDVAVGIFNEMLTEQEKAEIRKKKSIWLNVNGKTASFVVFFDLKRESKSFSRELLLEYSVYFVRDNYGRLYFPGNNNRTQFTFKEFEILADDVNGLSGYLEEGSELSFNLKKNKVSKT